MLTYILLQNIIVLARQGLPMRGNWVPAEDSDGGGSEQHSNFHQLMLLRAKDDPSILDNYHETQNTEVHRSPYSK